MGDTPLHPSHAHVRLGWLDVMKGLSILWIVFFHFFTTYDDNHMGWPLDRGFFANFIDHCHPASLSEWIGCTAEACWVGAVKLGLHAVSVFLVLSGFGLTYSLTKPGAVEKGWKTWYLRRVLRLFPMYWIAHLIYLISPFVARPEPIDYRFLLSFFGDRVYPLDTIMFYMNPAWWYFGLLLQLYIAFPFLFRLLQKAGPGWFLAITALITFGSRYVMLVVHPVHGNYVQGAFFTARLWEFASGMFLGVYFRSRPGIMMERLFSGPALAAGIALYALGLLSYPGLYGSGLTYSFTDGLIGTGLFIILAHAARWCAMVPTVSKGLAYVGVYSYSLYLLHQPYVIYFGERMRCMELGAFTAAAGAIIAVIFLLCAPIEKFANKWTGKLLDHGLRTPSTTLSTPSGS